MRLFVNARFFVAVVVCAFFYFPPVFGEEAPSSSDTGAIEESSEVQKEAEAFIQDKKRYVDQTLLNIYEHSSSVRLWEGVGFMLAGATSMVWALRDQRLDPDAKAIILYGGSTLSFLLGVINFASTSEYERVYKEYYKPIPEATYKEISKKVVDGEAYIRYLAEESRRRNTLRGVVFSTVGILSTIWYASLTREERIEQYPLLPFGVVLLGLGAYSFYSETYAEAEFHRYTETWKNKNQSFYSTLKVSLLPTFLESKTVGALFNLSAQF